MSDTGLMLHLLGFNNERLSTGEIMGPALENFVIMELKKQITWSIIKPQIFHFRTQTGHVVDIVLEDRTGKLVGIEVKAGATIHNHDLKGLRAFAEAAGKRFHREIVLYTGVESIPFGNSLTALPVQSLWQGIT
jgi:predicted AAA+ superfamily ATPase